MYFMTLELAWIIQQVAYEEEENVVQDLFIEETENGEKRPSIVVDHLKKSLENAPIAIVEITLHCMGNITANQYIGGLIKEELTLIRQLYEICKRSDGETLLRGVLWVLGNLCKYRQVESEQEKIECAIMFHKGLSSDDKHVLADTLEALEKLITNANERSLVILSCYEDTIELLTNHLRTGLEEDAIFNPVFYILCEMLTSNHDPLIDKLLESGIIDAFYSTLHQKLDNAEIVRDVIWAMSNLSYSNRKCMEALIAHKLFHNIISCM